MKSIRSGVWVFVQMPIKIPKLTVFCYNVIPFSTLLSTNIDSENKLLKNLKSYNSQCIRLKYMFTMSFKEMKIYKYQNFMRHTHTHIHIQFHVKKRNINVNILHWLQTKKKRVYWNSWNFRNVISCRVLDKPPIDEQMQIDRETTSFHLTMEQINKMYYIFRFFAQYSRHYVWCRLHFSYIIMKKKLISLVITEKK